MPVPLPTAPLMTSLRSRMLPRKDSGIAGKCVELFSGVQRREHYDPRNDTKENCLLVRFV